MRIEVGNYIICSDPQCMWLEEKYTGKTKAGEGKEYIRRTSGYVRTFDELLESFVERKIRSSEATDIKKLLREFSDIERDIKALIKGGKRK